MSDMIHFLPSLISQVYTACESAGVSEKHLIRHIEDAAGSINPVGLILFAVAIMGSVHNAKAQRVVRLASEIKRYSGGCHCGMVTFDVDAPRHLVAWDCNCSICVMKKNWHFIVPFANFHLTSGADKLTEYRFNTKVACHVFCSNCGVQAYYRPRSNPDGVAVTLACIPPELIESSEVRKFDGSNWEAFFVNSGISKFSKASS